MGTLRIAGFVVLAVWMVYTAVMAYSIKETAVITCFLVDARLDENPFTDTLSNQAQAALCKNQVLGIKIIKLADSSRL